MSLLRFKKLSDQHYAIYQDVPNPSGLSTAPPIEETVVTLTTEDLQSLLTDMNAHDRETGELSMLARPTAVPTHLPLVPTAGVNTASGPNAVPAVAETLDTVPYVSVSAAEVTPAPVDPPTSEPQS